MNTKAFSPDCPFCIESIAGAHCHRNLTLRLSLQPDSSAYRPQKARFEGANWPVLPADCILALNFPLQGDALCDL
jgi:hypothetical protein